MFNDWSQTLYKKIILKHENGIYEKITLEKKKTQKKKKIL